MSFTGNLLAESLRKDEPLDAVLLTVRTIRRADGGDPSAGQPLTWTFIEFEVAEDSVEAFAAALADALDQGPWYCDFRSDTETFVVFAGRVFRYPRGDQSRREEAEEYARSVGVPESQIDWRT
jgi:hypothetical protein